jgi:hypothetical protein
MPQHRDLAFQLRLRPERCRQGVGEQPEEVEQRSYASSSCRLAQPDEVLGTDRALKVAKRLCGDAMSSRGRGLTRMREGTIGRGDTVHSIEDESPSDDGSQPAYSMDWLKNILSEEVINKELDAHQRIEEVIGGRGC